MNSKRPTENSHLELEKEKELLFFQICLESGNQEIQLEISIIWASSYFISDLILKMHACRICTYAYVSMWSMHLSFYEVGAFTISLFPVMNFVPFKKFKYFII